ncbi:tetratricopeptide repeat protein [Pseudoflavitalea rhizosphaerae]|uniref:tetratricopeptide repeat protein n=1 Tax=Pseudoflavitalea rhizosphaerae TaxID=1884793 RepID=UPI000F8CD9AF|nr:hypothetical protein [Pseudoflavitalea rhizosphaerae]
MRSNSFFLAVFIMLVFCCTALARQEGKMPTKEEIKQLLEKMLLQYPPSEREKMRKQLEANLYKSMEAGAKQQQAAAKLPAFFPAKNSEELNKLPMQPLSGASLQAFVKKIHSEVNARLTAAQLKEINQKAAGKKPLVLNQLAVMAYFFQNNPLAGYALAARACDAANPGMLELNNLAAMLQLGGFPQKAIPILQFIDAKFPGNPVVSNNLGQAYALLGDKEKTKFYLMACIRTAPLHPEANNTMAHLEASNNNMTQAGSFVSNSLKGGHTSAAQLLEGKLPEKNRAIPYPAIDLPDAFNEFKLKFPPSLLTIEDLNIYRETKDEWQKKWWAEITKVMELRNKYGDEGKKLLEQEIAKAQKAAMEGKLYTFGRTFSIMAAAQMNRRDRNFKSQVPDYMKSWKSARDEVAAYYEKKKKSLSASYAEQMKGLDCGQGPQYKGCEKLMKLKKELCAKLLEATNEYFKNDAGVMDDYRRKVQNAALQEFYFRSYMGYLAGLNEPMARYAFYEAAYEYLNRIEKLKDHSMHGGSETDWTACPPQYRKGKKDIDLKPKWEFECPVDVELPFFVGKIKFNCKEASFSMGAGAGFSFSQNFETHQYTFSMGIGGSIDKTFKIPGVEGKIEASINQSIYITYDGKKKLTDLGLKFGTGVSAGYGFGGSLPGGAGLDEDGILTPIGGPGWSKDGNKIEDNIGYTISINSGFEPNISFQESKLMNLFPGVKQIHPNVKLYTK